MKHVNRRSLILLAFLLLLLVQFGRWQGQINEIIPSESGNNTVFLLLYGPALFTTLYVNRQWGYLAVFRPLHQPLALFLVVIIGVGLFRGDLPSAARNMTSIVLTYSLILGLSAMSFSLPFRRMIDVYILFIAGLFLPITLVVHLTKVGPLVLFPDRLESNNLRLGGLIYYAHTAMLLGVGGLFALYQFLNQRVLKSRLCYGLVFLVLNGCMLFTDCRSLWGGVALSYALLILFTVSVTKRWLLIGLVSIGVLLVNSGVLSIGTAKQYRVSDDFVFRMAIWNLALEGIRERPVTGYGVENYFATNSRAMAMDERLSDPHSATLSLMLQSGLLVTILFYCLYYRAVRHYYQRSFGQRKPLVAVCVFWFLVPFFWGNIYNGAAGLMQILFPLTYFISLLHPGLYAPPPGRAAPAPAAPQPAHWRLTPKQSKRSNRHLRSPAHSRIL